MERTKGRNRKSNKQKENENKSSGDRKEEMVG